LAVTTKVPMKCSVRSALIFDTLSCCAPLLHQNAALDKRIADTQCQIFTVQSHLSQMHDGTVTHRQSVIPSDDANFASFPASLGLNRLQQDTQCSSRVQIPPVRPSSDICISGVPAASFTPAQVSRRAGAGEVCTLPSSLCSS